MRDLRTFSPSFDGLPDSAIAVSLSGEVLFWNRAAESKADGSPVYPATPWDVPQGRNPRPGPSRSRDARSVRGQQLHFLHRGSLEVSAAGKAAPAVAEDGGGRAARGRRGARLQQSLDRDPRLHGARDQPFFTTKAKDRGTGLGLSTVYGIIKQSGGWIWVYSEPGRGTTVKIYLPEVNEVAETIQRRVETQPSRGSETILLAEDEAPVRKLARKALENLGYTVLEASRGEEALSISRSHAGPIHLVLTDVVMPEMGGADLASRVQELRPVSGYTDDAIIRHKVLERGTHFLQKPFTPASLARKVREALS